MKHTKKEWRRLLLDARRALGPVARAASSRLVVERLASRAEFTASRALLVYLPIGTEADPAPLVRQAHVAGKNVYCPDGGSAEPWWLRVLDDRDAGAGAGTTAPVVVPAEGPLLVVVPGVGFDLQGVRLGRGRGFYDRALAVLRRTASVFAVGFGFEAQVVRRLPRDPWDQSVDLVVTEQRCIVPGSPGDPRRTRRRAQEAREP